MWRGVCSAVEQFPVFENNNGGSASSVCNRVVHYQDALMRTGVYYAATEYNEHMQGVCVGVYQPTSVPVYQSISLLVFYPTSLPVHYSTSLLPHYSTTLPLSHSFTVPLPYYSTVLLSCYSVFILFYFPTVLFSHCSPVVLFYFRILWLYCYCVVWQLHLLAFVLLGNFVVC